MWYVVASVVLLMMLPGLFVHVQSLRFLKKNGEENAIWQSLSPLSLFLILFVAVPIYSFGFFTLLFHPQLERVAGIKLAYEQLKAQTNNTISNNAIRLSVIVGFASLFGIKLDEAEK